MTTTEIMRLLAMRFGPPAFAFFREVVVGNGRVDAVAVSLWPSRGLGINGFEVKTSRSDWLRELGNPEKADRAFFQVDRWWVVAPPNIVKPDELPEGWGHLVAHGKQLRRASPLTPKPIPATMPRALMARLLQRMVTDWVPRHEVEAKCLEAREIEARQAALMAELTSTELRELQGRIQAFERASGVTLDRWTSGAAIGEAVRYVLERGAGRVRKDIEAMRDSARRIVANLDGELAELPE